MNHNGHDLGQINGHGSGIMTVYSYLTDKSNPDFDDHIRSMHCLLSTKLDRGCDIIPVYRRKLDHLQKRAEYSVSEMYSNIIH